MEGAFQDGTTVAGAVPAPRSHDDDCLLFNTFGQPGVRNARATTRQMQIFLLGIYRRIPDPMKEQMVRRY